MSTHIQAQPLFSRHVGAAPFTFYHERYLGFSADAHSHDDLQLLLPLGGRLGMVVSGEEHLVGPEWAAILLPGASHSSTFLNGDLDFVSIYAPAGWFPELAEPLGATAIRDVISRGKGGMVVRDARIWLLAQHMASEIDTPGIGTERMLKAGLEQLGIVLARLLVAPPSKPLLEEPRVMRAVDRILRDYAEELTVEGLAAEVAMSPRHFERRFKEAVGNTPRRFLIEVRIGAARDLLASTDRSVAAIAWDAGFKNLSHFSATFQQVVGVSPTAYRRQKGRE